MRIQDKVIVITGGASGLGLASAHYLLREKGARIAIFDLNVEAGNKAVAELGAERALFVPTDVSNEQSVQQAVDAVMAQRRGPCAGRRHAVAQAPRIVGAKRQACAPDASGNGGNGSRPRDRCAGQTVIAPEEKND